MTLTAAEHRTSQEATVEVLAAEVRVLMVGRRQVTLSVFRQLDWAAYRDVEPFGRIRDPHDADGLVFVGRDKATGALVRSAAEHPEIMPGDWDRDIDRLRLAWERGEAVVSLNGETFEGREAIGMGLAQYRQNREDTAGDWARYRQQMLEIRGMSLIILAGLT